MSTYAKTFLTCDSEDYCEAVIEHRSARHARTLARRKGWKVGIRTVDPLRPFSKPEVLDYCPLHRDSK